MINWDDLRSFNGGSGVEESGRSWYSQWNRLGTVDEKIKGPGGND